jgi:hypothetical protein
MIKTITKQTEEGTLTITIKADKYFSITGELKYKDRSSCGGCIHDEILKAAPHLVPFVNLHLATLDGKPMHTIENGFYWLKKAAGIPQKYEPEQTPKECFSILQKHLRIDDCSARTLLTDCIFAYNKNNNAQDAKIIFVQEVDKLLPQWEKEAQEALKVLESF